MSALLPKTDMCGHLGMSAKAIADILPLFDHFGGAGSADEWWSTILQSLPSFAYVKL